jgi:photosystem II stability/assembly factor-like uncharacterized protein
MVILGGSFALYGLSRSSHPGGSARDVAGKVGADADDPALPSDYLDFKDSSAQAVSGAEVARAINQAKAVPTDSVAGWQLVGPTNVGGRVTDLVVDPRRPNTIYVASAGGGVWKSTDAGATFQSIWPTSFPQAIGSVALGSDGTLWAGTGEANPSGGGLTFFGNGVYRSTDGGASWQQWGLRDSGAIGRIVVDPQDPSRVFVAASGSISQIVSQRGIYELTSGGKDWRLVLAPPNDTTGGIDIALDPANSNRVYAALWDHHRNNGARDYGGVGSGLYRSDDGGGTWTRLQNIVGPVCSYDTTGSGLTSDPSLGRIGIAVAPSDPNRVYVVFGTPYGPDKGFYVSNDGGDSFTCGGRPGASGGYQWWFGHVWVDPTNENHVFSADVNLRESFDGGQTWHSSLGVHADQHAMEWDPNVPGRIYLGNDGGTYRSDSNGASGSWVHASYEPWNQSYHLAVASDDASRLATGLQDQGSVRTWTASSEPTDLTQWNSFNGGDGHYVAIDPTDHSYYYTCFQPVPPSQDCSGFHDSGGTTTRWSFPNGIWPTGTRWTTDMPLVLDPSDPSVVYIGGSVLARSTDRGHTFTVISPPDPNSLPGEPPLDEQDQGPFYANEYATITAIAPAKTDPQTIYVGTDTGRVWKTTDLGAHWTQLQGLPTRWVNAIVVDPTNANHVYAAFSGYREGDNAANVWTSTDGGASWQNISGNLPNAPVEMLTYDQARKQIYAAMDLGAFYLKNANKNWARIGDGLPDAPILDLRPSGDDRTLFAATFGRSVWKLQLPAP